MLDFDRTILLERLGGDEKLFEEIMGVFLVDGPRLVADLKAFVDKRDFEGVHLKAHTLQGAAGSVGAANIESLLIEIESECRAGEFDNSLAILEKTEEALVEIKNVLNR
jgi:HPt (histidine-containing phosphotransfer) domain-containing protein